MQTLATGGEDDDRRTYMGDCKVTNWSGDNTGTLGVVAILVVILGLIAGFVIILGVTARLIGAGDRRSGGLKSGSGDTARCGVTDIGGLTSGIGDLINPVVDLTFASGANRVARGKTGALECVSLPPISKVDMVGTEI